MQTDTIEGRAPSVAAVAEAMPTALDALRTQAAESAAAATATLARNLNRFRRSAARFVVRQTRFNQLARYPLALLLVAGAPAYVGQDRAPLPSDHSSAASESAANSAGPAAAPSPSALVRTAMPAPAPAPVAAPGTVQRVPVAIPQEVDPADQVAGPRIRAICSRAGQTVFLDDRSEAKASADWREEVSLTHPGAVCAFTSRFGVADPQFRAIETNTVAAPAVAAPPVEDRMPILVRTMPVTADMLAPPDIRATNFAPAYERADDPAKEQIDQALAALAGPSQRTGAKLPVAALPKFAAPLARTPVRERRPAAIEPPAAQAAPVPTQPPAAPDTASLSWGADAGPVGHVELDSPLVKADPKPAPRFVTAPSAAPAPAHGGRFGDDVFVEPFKRAPETAPAPRKAASGFQMRESGWSSEPTAIPAGTPKADRRSEAAPVDFGATFAAVSTSFRVVQTGAAPILVADVRRPAAAAWTVATLPPSVRIAGAFASAAELPLKPVSTPAEHRDASPTLLAGL